MATRTLLAVALAAPLCLAGCRDDGLKFALPENLVGTWQHPTDTGFVTIEIFPDDVRYTDTSPATATAYRWTERFRDSPGYSANSSDWYYLAIIELDGHRYYFEMKLLDEALTLMQYTAKVDDVLTDEFTLTRQ